MAVLFGWWVGDAVSALTVLMVAMYLYASRNFGYWSKRGVRCVPPTPFFGSIRTVVLMRENVGSWLHTEYRRMSGEPFFGAYLSGRPALVVRDLDLVKRVLVKDAHVFLDRVFMPQEDADPLLSKNLFGLRGRKWRHLRVKLTPTFTSGKMRRMFYLVDECGRQLASCLAQEASAGTCISVKDVMGRYSTDVIASCAFGVNSNALADPKCEFQTMLKRTFDCNSLGKKIATNLVFLLPAMLKWLRLQIIDDDVYRFVRRIFWDVVEERRKSGMAARKDFVDLLMKIKDEGEVKIEDAKDLEEVDQSNANIDARYSRKDVANVSLDDDDFASQAFVFLLAGFETSSWLLVYTMYELALNTGVQDRLRREVSAVLARHGGQLSYDAIAEMSYLDMVVSEALRKYPIQPFLDRVCLADYEIPGTEVTIQKGTPVFIPVMGIHRDPDIYPEPHKYDPDRFSPENRSKRCQYSYLPFGEGPRMCIGNRFALMQVKTAVVHTLASHQVRPCAQTPAAPLRFKTTSIAVESAEDVVLAFTRL